MSASVLSSELTNQLKRVPTSHDWGLRYAPCRVRLRSGEVLDRVYLVEETAFFRVWGNDPNRPLVDPDEIALIEDSPFRLPASLADIVYQAGESGMGYTIFTVRMRDGTTLPFLTGNAVDFPDWPPGHDPSDAVAVEPHVGRDQLHGANTGTASVVWCLYRDNNSAAR